MPCIASLGADACVSRHSYAIGDNESLRFAVDFRPRGSGLRQLLRRSGTTVVNSATREFGGFGPFYLRIELPKDGDGSLFFGLVHASMHARSFAYAPQGFASSIPL
jgi:hypothetical protein